MIIKYKNKKIEVPAKKVSFFGEAIGLILRTKNTSNLLFEFKRKVHMPIHSLFVFFSFLAIWLDEENKVLEFEIVPPFRFHILPKKSFNKLIEVPLNRNNKEIIEFFVDKR